MGQGGYLKLINATTCKWQKTGQHSYQMNSWNLPDSLDVGGSERVYVEYSQGIFENPTDDGAETNYKLEGTDRHFQVQARSGDRYFKPNLRVDLQNVQWDDPDIQPIPPKSDIVDLGWNHDGEVSFTLVGVPKNMYSIISYKDPIRQMSENEIKDLSNYIKEKVDIKDEDANIPKILAEYAKENPENSIKYLLENAAIEKIGKELVFPSIAIKQQEQVHQAKVASNNEDYWLRRWMYKYRNLLKELKVEELSIPGTHDSGTYDMVSVVSEPWTKTQNLNIYNQLNYGTRALDLRIGLQPSKSGDERFILVHDTWRTHVTVADALNQVLNFSNNESSEIIILDFHRFIELEKADPEDYEELVAIVKSTLGNKIIPHSDKNKTLEQLWETDGRIIVAWNRGGGDEAFWPGVSQKWFDKSSKSELYGAIEKEMEKSHTGLWSICAILTASAFHPIQSLNPDLSMWFAPDSSWSEKANIVSCDFIEKTQLAQSLITASVLKGAKRINEVSKKEELQEIIEL